MSSSRNWSSSAYTPKRVFAHSKGVSNISLTSCCLRLPTPLLNQSRPALSRYLTPRSGVQSNQMPQLATQMPNKLHDQQSQIWPTGPTHPRSLAPRTPKLPVNLLPMVFTGPHASRPPPSPTLTLYPARRKSNPANPTPSTHSSARKWMTHRSPNHLLVQAAV